MKINQSKMFQISTYVYVICEQILQCRNAKNKPLYIYKILLKTKPLITVLYITTRNNYSYVMASLKGRV